MLGGRACARQRARCGRAAGLGHALDRRHRDRPPRRGEAAEAPVTRYERGFTLVELLVAACITLLVTAAIVAAARPAEHVFLTQSEAADELQRSRVATSALFRDLVMAGAGPDAGPDAGSLARAFAPILPWHQGRTGGDQAGVFRDDAITLSYVPSSRAQTTIASPMPAQSGIVRVNTGAGCPLSDAACGFSQATTVLAYDDTGSADTFRVENVVDSVLELRHTSADSLKVYPVGSRLVQAIVRSYFLEADEASDQVQLVRDDGTGGPSVAIVDHEDVGRDPGRRAFPAKSRREVLAVTGVAARDGTPAREGRARERERGRHLGLDVRG